MRQRIRRERISADVDAPLAARNLRIKRYNSRRHDAFKPRRQINSLARWPGNDLTKFQHEVRSIEAGAPLIPKFPSYRCTLVCELLNQRSASALLILVRLLNLRFLNHFASI